MIPPGGQGQVTASIDSARFKGRISKSVTLYSNDPDAERTLLRLSAEILVPVDVQPRDRIVVRGKAGDIEPQVLHLIATEGEVFDVLSVDKRRDDIEVKIVPAPDKQVVTSGKTAAKAPKLKKDAIASGHSAYEMTVSFSAKSQVGSLADRIRVETTHPKMPTIDVNVSGRIEGAVTVRPERLFFLTRGGTSTMRQEVRLTKRPEGGLEIKKVTSTDPNFEAKLTPVAEGKEYLIEVLRAEASAGQPSQASLVVETNDPVQGRIEIPIIAR